MNITLATPADIPQLCQLLAILFSQEAEFAPDLQAQQRGLAAVIANPAVGQILVARQEGQVLGMVSLLYTISTALGGRVAWLEDLVVAPSARGVGLGSRLMAEAKQLAHAQGCLRVTLLTDRDNLAAQRFYQRHGFTPSAMTPMRLPLGR